MEREAGFDAPRPKPSLFAKSVISHVETSHDEDSAAQIFVRKPAQPAPSQSFLQRMEQVFAAQKPKPTYVWPQSLGKLTRAAVSRPPPSRAVRSVPMQVSLRSETFDAHLLDEPSDLMRGSAEVASSEPINLNAPVLESAMDIDALLNIEIQEEEKEAEDVSETMPPAKRSAVLITGMVPRAMPVGPKETLSRSRPPARGRPHPAPDSFCGRAHRSIVR